MLDKSGPYCLALIVMGRKQQCVLWQCENLIQEERSCYEQQKMRAIITKAADQLPLQFLITKFHAFYFHTCECTDL